MSTRIQQLIRYYEKLEDDVESAFGGHGHSRRFHSRHHRLQRKPALKPKPRLSQDQLDRLKERRASFATQGGAAVDESSSNEEESTTSSGDGDDVEEKGDSKYSHWRYSVQNWQVKLMHVSSVAFAVGFMHKLG